MQAEAHLAANPLPPASFLPAGLARPAANSTAAAAASASGVASQENHQAAVVGSVAAGAGHVLLGGRSMVRVDPEGRAVPAGWLLPSEPYYPGGWDPHFMRCYTEPQYEG